MAVNEELLRSLEAEGYCVVPDIIPQDEVQAVRDHWLRRPGKDPEVFLRTPCGKTEARKLLRNRLVAGGLDLSEAAEYTLASMRVWAPDEAFKLLITLGPGVLGARLLHSGMPCLGSFLIAFSFFIFVFIIILIFFLFFFWFGITGFHTFSVSSTGSM